MSYTVYNRKSKKKRKELLEVLYKSFNKKHIKELIE